MPRPINDPGVIADILATKGRIAIVGLSPKEHRDSNKVGKYLVDHGYTIVPVHPAGQDVFGLTTYKSLHEIDGPVEVVDVFLNPDNVGPVVDAAIEIGAKAIWFQLGVVNQDAAQKAHDAGLEVVMDRCIKIEHAERM